MIFNLFGRKAEFVPTDFFVPVDCGGKKFKINVGDLQCYKKTQAALAEIQQMQANLATIDPKTGYDELLEKLTACIDAFLGYAGATKDALGDKANNFYNCYEFVLYLNAKMTAARFDLTKRKAAQYAKK